MDHFVREGAEYSYHILRHRLYHGNEFVSPLLCKFGISPLKKNATPTAVGSHDCGNWFGVFDSLLQKLQRRVPELCSSLIDTTFRTYVSVSSCQSGWTLTHSPATVLSLCVPSHWNVYSFKCKVLKNPSCKSSNTTLRHWTRSCVDFIHLLSPFWSSKCPLSTFVVIFHYDFRLFKGPLF